MAKTRMLKHELRVSEKVASWPIPVRYFWVLLWGYLDDHGKGKDNPLLVKADCFPLDPDITAETIDGWLSELESAGVVARYTVDGTDYIAAVHWTEHQKPPHPTKDVLPAFDDPRAVRRGLHASRMKDAGRIPEELTPGLGWVESGIESSPAVTNLVIPSLEEPFEEAWSHWPKKVERKDAFDRFKKATKRLPIEDLKAAIIRFGDAYAATTERQFVPALGAWLNKDRWTDELPGTVGRPQNRPNPDAWMNA
ncbi:MAG: hypothetical protein K0Q46_2510 [Rhodococcus erythropolis]|jgi:hypothetical protein|nr:hypothetical protein [Rhodococcus erythropolis]MDF2895724.1 hypothetical protein [Rhodococcus erythropolis]